MVKKVHLVLITAATVLSFTFTGVATADNHRSGGSDPIAEFFESGSAYINFRYRYELVDQDGITKDANASTLRTRIGMKSGRVHGIRGHVEVEDVTEIGPDNYNSTVNGVTDRPVVADPDGTEINVMTLDYDGIPDSTVLVGRYKQTLDNVRFIGDVGWRQNNQTFDGATFTNTSIDDLRFFYGYINNVNRIFGDDSVMGDVDSNSHLFNLHYSGIENATLTGYAYLLDLGDLAAASTTSYGGRVDVKHPMNDDWTLLLDGEYAFQSDYEDNPGDYEVHYFRAGAGVKFDSLVIKGGYESLGSDDGAASFSTPLATLHKWNGWADKFLVTPAAGLNDAYGMIGYTVNGVHNLIDGTKLSVFYHNFTSDEGSMDYGTEWDANISMKFADHYNFGVKFAYYDADEFATDTTKLIFSLGGSFETA